MTITETPTWASDYDEAIARGTTVAALQAERRAAQEAPLLTPKAAAKLSKAEQELAQKQAEVEAEQQRQYSLVHAWDVKLRDIVELKQRAGNCRYHAEQARGILEGQREWMRTNAGSPYGHQEIERMNILTGALAAIPEWEAVIASVDEQLATAIESARSFGAENGVPESNWPTLD